MKREEKRRRELENQFGTGFYNDNSSDGDQDAKEAGMPLSRPQSDSFSDTVSDFEDDRWGGQIGTYDESLPPPVRIVRHSVWVGDQEAIIDTEDMEKMLESGWDDKAFKTKPVSKGPPHLQLPSAFNNNRLSKMGMFPGSARDAPAVPPIPSRYSTRVSYMPESYEMERTPSPGEYASLMRGAAPSPATESFPHSEQPYGQSSAVSGQQGHARNRSAGGTATPPTGSGYSPPRQYGAPPPGPPQQYGAGRGYHDRFG